MTRELDMNIRPGVYTVREVQVILQIGRRKAYDMIGSGEIPSIKVGNSIRIPRIPFERKFGLSA